MRTPRTKRSLWYVATIVRAFAALCVAPAASSAAGVLTPALIGPAEVIEISSWAQVNDANQVGGSDGQLPARWQNGKITTYTLGPEGVAAGVDAIEREGAPFGVLVPEQ